ncbi:hypothetical protein Q7P37_009905 [Cladosporium fusiforme]
MSSAILDGHSGRSACDEHLSALTSPIRGPDAKAFSMLQDVSGGCWVRICHHIPWNAIGSNEAESVDLDNIMTQDTDSKTPEIVKRCASREVGPGTVRYTQRTHSTVGDEVDISNRAVAGDSQLLCTQLQPTTHARLGKQHPRAAATSPNGRVLVEDSPNLRDAKSLYPQALVLPQCHSSTIGSAGKRSIAASSGLLSPWLMPSFHRAESRSEKGSTHETSHSSSACSFDVDEIIDFQPCLDDQPGHSGSKIIEGKFREMWQKVQSRNAKRRGSTRFAKSTSRW